MSVVLDAGAFIALERDEPKLWERIVEARLAGNPPLTHGGVVAQVWRGGSVRQARLARALRGAHIVPLDDALGRRAGVLLARSGLVDAIDAALVVLCRQGDQIVTSDPDDIAELADAARVNVEIVRA